MEWFNIESLEQAKFVFKAFFFFITIPAIAWWWNFITGFFATQYEDDDPNCCPHCHIHVPNPNPSPDLSGGGMAVPPMKIPSPDREYDYLDRK